LTAIPWLDAAYTELVAGVREISGPHHNLRILEYLNATTLGDAGGDETPWCSAFVNFCCRVGRVSSTGSAAARSWLSYGFPLHDEPRLGCITVLWRGDPHGALGHVGFYLGDNGGAVHLLGGNQGNRVSVQSFPRTRVLAYRWPT
jgi:uncharacterized protein (TIGR02594 family)